MRSDSPKPAERSQNSESPQATIAPVNEAKSLESCERQNDVAGLSDPVEAALAEAIKGATAAGEWAVVAQLARELEARRNAHSAPNVTQLRPPKKDTGR